MPCGRFVRGGGGGGGHLPLLPPPPLGPALASVAETGRLVYHLSSTVNHFVCLITYICFPVILFAHPIILKSLVSNHRTR